VKKEKKKKMFNNRLAEMGIGMRLAMIAAGIFMIFMAIKSCSGN